MKVNRGSVLSKEYFIAYFRHVMLVFQCNKDEARLRTLDQLFRGNLDAYGEETRQNFDMAFNEFISRY